MTLERTTEGVLPSERIGGTTKSDVYTYDPLGNRLSKTAGTSTTYYSYDAANQLPAVCVGTHGCAQNVSYDLNGNVTAGPSTSYACNAENRLVWASVTGQVEQTYAYDDQGRRIRKTVGATTTQYLYDGPDIVAEYSTWAAPTARTTHGPGTDDPILRATATATQYYHADGLGSVVAVSNGTGGTDATGQYDAWGVRIGGTGTIPVYGYTGREPDETGLVYYRARYYDPTLGRFTQRDPIGLNGGLNVYAYVGGNPINLTDPLGLAPNGPSGMSFSRDPVTGITRLTFSVSSDHQSLAAAQPSSSGFDWGDFGAGFGQGAVTGAAVGVGAAVAIATGPVWVPTALTVAAIAGLGYTAYQAWNVFTNPAVTSAQQAHFLGQVAGGVVGGAVAGGLTAGALAPPRPVAGASRAGTVSLSDKGLKIVEQHLATFGPDEANLMMVGRLHSALQSGQRISGADKNFYLHELAEATMMARGMSAEAAHLAAINKYRVSPFSLYHPEVILKLPGHFNENWLRFWGIGP